MSVSIVWLNEHTARIYHISEDRMEREVLGGDATSDTGCETIASQLEHSKQILILSPGETGKDLVSSLQSRFPHLAKRIVGCETLASANDAEIANYAIKYFRKPVSRPVS